MVIIFVKIEKCALIDSDREEFGLFTGEVDVLGFVFDCVFGGGMFSDVYDDVDLLLLLLMLLMFYDVMDDVRILGVKEKLIRNRKVVSEILGDDFLGEEFVLEFCVYMMYILVGELDV